MRSNTIMTGAIIVIVTLASFGQNSNILPPRLLFELLALNGDLDTKLRPKYCAPVDIIFSKGNGKLYVAEQTAKRVVEIDTASATVTKTILMPNEPTGLAVSPDGAVLFVTCSSERWPAGIVCFVATASGKISKNIPVGHSARCPMLSADGKTLYVCNLYEDNVSVVDVATGAETPPRIKVTREPYAAEITPDGKTLVITNALPDGKATDTSLANPIACKVTLVNTSTKEATAIKLPRGSHSLFGLCISSDSKYAFITHLTGRFNFPATQVNNGWIHTNNIAVIDLVAKKLINDVTLDYAQSGMGNPWGLAITPNNKYLCVLLSGVNKMTMLDLSKFIGITTSILNSTGDSLAYSFSSLATMRQDVSLSVSQPRVLAIAGTKAYIPGYFSDDINVVDVSSLSPNPPTRFSLSNQKKNQTNLKFGEQCFYDASLCQQGWQSCHSCHPFTRPDALNWILQQTDGFQKNAKSMLYAWWTPPTQWKGTRPGCGGPNGSIRMGFRNELFVEPISVEPQAVALDTFFMYLKPLASPHLAKGRLSPEAIRGKAIYNSTSKGDCRVCHPAPLFTDMQPHNVGVPDPFDAASNFDTPSLIETWRTYPYGHLGSMDSLSSILKTPGHSAGVSGLSVQEFKDLLEYVLSL